MPQLQINQGPQDALLYDNTRSYFTNVGYVRTSNFQMELRDVDPQNTAQLGSTVQFVIPKAADLLGPCDLMVDFQQPNITLASANANSYTAWVESIGFAMIERITFSVGSHDIETITGDQLNIMNELMRGDEQRLGTKQILKTGRGATSFVITGGSAGAAKADEANGRLITNGTTKVPAKKLIVPLGLFFTKHPSQYFPLCAVAGCNDVRISIKFRTLNELVVMGFTTPAVASSVIDSDAAIPANSTAPEPSQLYTDGSAFKSSSCKLRCHYVHVTGPEATTLMNKEHVRLLKLWQHNPKPFTTLASTVDSGVVKSAPLSIPIDLSFLHPVQELIITVRKKSEMSSSVAVSKPETQNQGAVGKNYFAYHGGGKDPNLESWRNRTTPSAGGVSSGGVSVVDAGGANTYLDVQSFKLTLNGQERHPSLAGVGLDKSYLMNRLMPMMHSNTSSHFSSCATGSVLDGSELDFQHLGEMMDRKEIYVYPFALNPEGSNPSGAVNFSKVSHAKLTIEGLSYGQAEDYQVDVYGVHYNWLQIKDGRALTSFA